MNKVKFFTILSLVIAAMVGGYVVMESIIIPTYNKKSIPKYEIGKCYKAEDDNPFAEPLYIKIIDKKKGYVKYVFSDTPQEKYSVSRPEWWLNDIYKEVDCASFEKERP